MRVLHTSDWHLGRRFHGHDLLDEQRAFIDWLGVVLRERNIDLLVVAGDVYDRAVPPLDAVIAWQEALVGFTDTCPILVTAGNHDSPTRLGFAGSLLEEAGVHLRTDVSEIDRPLLVTGRDGVVLAAYGLPYLEPDLHREALGAERSHTAVLTSALDRVRADVARREGVRTLVCAHAFITGSGDVPVISESERDLRVGGVGDAPSHVFAGIDFVALGHLHGAQLVRSPGEGVVSYSGSPVAFSFSEESHLKSVTVIDIPAAGPVTLQRIPTPVTRPLATIRGDLESILSDEATPAFADHWVRVVLTDARRPADPMPRLRAILPYVAELTFERSAAPTDPTRRTGTDAHDPLALAESFVSHVTSTPAGDTERHLIRDAVERVRIDQVPT